MNKKITGFIIIVFLLIFGCIDDNSNSNDLNNNNQNLFSYSEDEFNIILSDVNNCYKELEIELKENKVLLSENKKIDDQVTKILDQIEKYQSSIRESISWYKGINLSEDEFKQVILEKEKCESELEKIKSENETLRLEKINTSTKTQESLTIIEQAQKDINDAIEWYITNSTFNPNNKFHKDVIKQISSKFRFVPDNPYMGHSSCDIDPFYTYYPTDTLSNELLSITITDLNIEYLEDEITTGQSDKLLSLEQYIVNKGGDCEDISLFYKAQLNYMIEKCLKLSDYVWSGNPFEEGISAYNRYNYASVVCGGYYYLIEDEGEVYVEPIDDYGHCVVARNNLPVNSSKDVNNLIGSQVIDPQIIANWADWDYLGSEGYYVINELSEGDYYFWVDDETIIIVDEIITNSDHLKFDYEKEKWMGYSDLYHELSDLREQLLDQQESLQS